MHRVKRTAKNANLHAREDAEETQKGRGEDAGNASCERSDSARRAIADCRVSETRPFVLLLVILRVSRIRTGGPAT
jgi:hypothetical protein